MSAPEASAKQLFVLGTLAIRPAHGHEIMRLLGASRADLWTELSEKHVYYILNRLERDGFVSAAEQREGARPARRVFAITPAGLREFERLMRADSLVASVPYSDFDVVFGMLAYTDRLTAAEKTAVLEKRAAHLRAVIADATDGALRAAEQGAPVLPTRVFDKVRRVAEAELDWLGEVLAETARNGWAPAAPAAVPEGDNL